MEDMLAMINARKLIFYLYFNIVTLFSDQNYFLTKFKIN